MRNYLALGQKILDEGIRVKNRTGIDTIRLIGGQLEFDLANGFPLVTTKKVNFNLIIGELIGFIRGYTNAADFRALGCTFWDINANVTPEWLANPNRQGTDDLGRIYGAQWRNWKTPDGKEIDQLKNAVETVISNPHSRRIIVQAWNPGELHLMSLPSCHKDFQLICDENRKELSLRFTLRSADYFMGTWGNIASYALLLMLIAKATGYTAKILLAQFTDLHLYINHLDQMRKQLRRTPLALPSVHIDSDLKGIELIDNITPEQIKLINYYSHDFIKAEMAA